MLDRLELARAGARAVQVEERVVVSAHRVGDPGAGGKAAPSRLVVAQQDPKLTLAPEERSLPVLSRAPPLSAKLV